MESLVDLEGRVRPIAVVAVEGDARRDESVDVKAALLALDTVAVFEDLGRGRP